MRLTIASFALLLAVGLVNAEDKKETTKKDVEDPKAFLPLALDEAMAIERFSSLADRRASSDKVKELARKLEADAKDYRKQLEKAAEGLKVGFLTGLREGNQATYVRLSTLTGEKFDDEYLKAIGSTLTSFNRHVADQEKSGVKDISTFVKERGKGINTHAENVRGMLKDRSKSDEKPKDK
jgi:predicted outer membrane protein